MVNFEVCRGDMFAKSPFFRKKVHFFKKFRRDSTLRIGFAGKILRPNRARKPDFGVSWEARNTGFCPKWSFFRTFLGSENFRFFALEKSVFRRFSSLKKSKNELNDNRVDAFDV